LALVERHSQKQKKQYPTTIMGGMKAPNMGNASFMFGKQDSYLCNMGESAAQDG